jgi:hypothetical protein
MLQNTLVLFVFSHRKMADALSAESCWLYALYKSYISRLRYRYSWVRKSLQLQMKASFVEILERQV